MFRQKENSKTPTMDRVHLRLEGDISEQMMQFAKGYVFCRLNHRILLPEIHSKNSIWNTRFLQDIARMLCINNKQKSTNEESCFEATSFAFDQVHLLRFGTELRSLFREQGQVHDYIRQTYEPNKWNEFFVHVVDSMDENYLKNAIDVVQTKFKDSNFTIVTASRDVIPCIYHHLRILEEPDSLARIFLMSRFSKGGILSRNLESWWGGFLSHHSNKTYIMPSGMEPYIPGALYCIHQ